MAHKAWGRGDKCDHCDQKHCYKKFMEIYKPVNDMSLDVILHHSVIHEILPVLNIHLQGTSFYGCMS